MAKPREKRNSPKNELLKGLSESSCPWRSSSHPGQWWNLSGRGQSWIKGQEIQSKRMTYSKQNA